MTNQELIAELQSVVSTADWSYEELTHNGPSGVVETVGAYVEQFMDSYGFDSDAEENEDLFSELCFVVYDFHGCSDLKDGSPEWNAHWSPELRNPDNLNIDVDKTHELIADADIYADAIEDLMQEYANKFFSAFNNNEEAALAYVRDNEEKVAAAGLVTLKQRIPEAFVAFLTNNPNYEYDELVEDFKSYAIIETLCGLLED